MCRFAAHRLFGDTIGKQWLFSIGYFFNEAKDELLHSGTASLRDSARSLEEIVLDFEGHDFVHT